MTKPAIMSSIMGKAYEYACLQTIYNAVGKIRPVEIEHNSSLEIAERCFSEISDQDRADMLKSARAGIDLIIQMEPKIIEDGNDKLVIYLQPDDVAKTGDIRDIIITRRSINWEIGISVKHNHAALKHSRLSQHIDFGNMWFKTPCSENYFETISQIFNRLSKLKEQDKLWKNIQDKKDSVYIPILTAFMNEFQNLFTKHKHKITNGIISYLLGSDGKDYYKLIHFNNHTTRVMPFNICGDLNQASKKAKPGIKIPKVKLPTKIIDLSFKTHSKTTVILTMDEGWSMSFRIHSASTHVEPSLKFDIQLQEQPAECFFIDAEW